MFKSGQLIGVGLAFLAIFCLGMIGYYETVSICSVYCLEGHARDTILFFIKGSTASLPNDPTWELSLAHFLAPWVLYIAVFLGALKLAIVNFRHDFRVARAKRKLGHVIVCGLGEIGLQIVENLREQKGKERRSVVVVDLYEDTPNAKTAERLDVTVIKGDARKPAMLRAAGARGAQTVIVCTGNDDTNLDIALGIEATASEARRLFAGPLLILVELRNEWLFRRLIDHDKQALGTANIGIRFFNTYQNTARLLLTQMIPPLATGPISMPVVIVGFGNMGREFAVQLLLAGFAPLGQPTRLVVLDQLGEALGEKFAPVVAPFSCSAEVIFHNCTFNPDDPTAWGKVGDLLESHGAAAVVVCLPDDNASLYVAVELRVLLDKLEHRAVPIFVRLGRHKRLGEFIGKIEQLPEYEHRLIAFGAYSTILSTDILIDDQLDRIAKAIHENWRNTLPEEQRSDPPAADWDILAEQYKESNRREADHFRVRLAQIGLSLIDVTGSKAQLFPLSADQIDLLAQLGHRRWMIERLRQGWTAGQPGDKKDFAKLVNPLLVDWSKLEEKERERNREAIGNMPQILADAGWEIGSPVMPEVVTSKIQVSAVAPLSVKSAA